MTRTVQAFVQNGRGDPIVAQLSASMADMEPVNRLMPAVLERAVSDFRTYAPVPTARGRQLFADVDAWFSSSVCGPFDFETICHATGLDPDYIRKGVRALRLSGCSTTGERGANGDDRGRAWPLCEAV